MGLRRQMHHRIRLVALKNSRHTGSIANIRMLKRIALVALHRGQRLQVTGIGERIYINNGVLCVLN